MRTILHVLLSALVVASAAAQDGNTPPPKPAKETTPAKEVKPAKDKEAAKETKPGKETQPAKDADGKPVTKTDAGKPQQVDDEGEDIPPLQLPASADPADIAAMQSAQAMLRAEARLKKLLKAGGIKGIDKILTFEELSNWTYQDGLKGMPEEVKQMSSKQVMMTGFMLPIDEVQNIKEFLLVQSLWSCCYGQPPDINGIVRVVMKGDKRVDYKYDPIKIVGEFKVEAAYEDGYCLDIYQLHADSVEVLK